MDDKILIDFNHVYFLISDKLFKEQFSPSKNPFNFEDSFKALDLESLKDDSSYYFLENSVPPLHNQVRHFLKQQGYIEDNDNLTLDTKLTDKGVETVEKGGIESYKSYRQRHEELQLKIQKSTLATNKTSIITAAVTTFAVVAGLVFSYWTYKTSKEANEIQRQTLELQKNSKTWDSLHHIENFHKIDSLSHK